MDKESPQEEAAESMQLVSDIYAALRSLEYDTQQRNLYMNRRDRYVYGDGLWETLEIPDGYNRTMYNFLRRVVDIHTAQVMGRPFEVYSNYFKDDVSSLEDLKETDPKRYEQELVQMELQNKVKQTDADLRKKFIDAIIRDNGGEQLFSDGARMGSVYGTTVYKMYWDDKKQKIKISLLESPQNYRAGWSSSDFRERDWDAYAWQISVSQAMREYSDKLGNGQDFVFSALGNPFDSNEGGMSTNGMTNDPINQHPNNPDLANQTQRHMVTCIDFTGYLDGWCMDNGEIEQCKRGDENKISVFVVGGQVVSQINDEKKMPKYYIISNRIVPRRSWGESDLPDSALEINADYIERMSDYTTLLNKTIFPMYQMIGFDPASIPKKKNRQMLAVSMTQEQKIEVVSQANQVSAEIQRLLAELKDDFIHVTGISRLMFDDPHAASDSNQSTLTSLKSITDIVEDKQKRWEPVITEMLEDALSLAAEYLPAVKDAITTDTDWYLRLEWPSTLRREDAVYQTHWLNLHNAGVISLDTYLEKIGIPNVSQELDRLRDNMKDPITAAVMGKQLGEVAHQTLNKSLGIPPWGYVIPKVSVKGDLSPQATGNIQQNFGWNDGPFGAAMGPTGNDGLKADDHFMNQGQMTNPTPQEATNIPTSVPPLGQPLQPQAPPQGGPGGPVSAAGGQVPQTAPIGGGSPAPQAPAPMMTTDNNLPGGAAPTSQPGSGATTTSGAGAVKKHNQNRGR